MTRPKKPQDERKSRIISYRVTDAEFTRIAHRAAVANLKINEMAKKLTLANAETLELRVCHKHDPVLIGELNRIGCNLNQLVKRFHMTGRVSPVIEILCDRIDELINQAIEEETP